MRISEQVIKDLRTAVANPGKYGLKGERNKLQATYDFLLGEVSMQVLGEQMQTRVWLRQRLLGLPKRKKDKAILALLVVMKNDDMLASQDYTANNPDVQGFLTTHMKAFLEALDA